MNVTFQMVYVGAYPHNFSIDYNFFFIFLGSPSIWSISENTIHLMSLRRKLLFLRLLNGLVGLKKLILDWVVKSESQSRDLEPVLW